MSVTLPGLRWHIPWPIETVEKINTNVTERFPYQGSMLTKDEAIVLVDLVVQYRRTDPQLYLFNLRDPEDTLRDITRSAIREIIGKNELDYILTDGREDVAAQTQGLVQATLDLYRTGITIDEVNLQEANFPRDVEASVQDAIKAREDKERIYEKLMEFKDKYNNLVKSKAELQANLIKGEEERLRISKALLDLQIENNQLVERSESEKYELVTKLLNAENDILELEMKEQNKDKKSSDLQEQLERDGQRARSQEDERYRSRQGEVSSLIAENTLIKLEREIEEMKQKLIRESQEALDADRPRCFS